ncbi:hypothetical protein GCM10010505_09530 [Kitasatospora aburaviensis]
MANRARKDPVSDPARPRGRTLQTPARSGAWVAMAPPGAAAPNIACTSCAQRLIRSRSSDNELSGRAFLSSKRSRSAGRVLTVALPVAVIV